MKRSRKLDDLVVDMAQESKAKDGDGNHLYEPIVLGFFGAPDALLEVLKDRPIVMLRLLQTNKAMEKFWNQFEQAWILWTDMLIENEMGVYVAEIYAFFVVHSHRKRKDAPIEADFIGDKDFSNAPRHELHIPFINTTSRNVWDPVFYVVYHDKLTRLFMALMGKLDDLPYQQDLQEGRLRRQYLTAEINQPPYFAVYPDCVLISQRRSVPLDFRGYNLDALRKGLPDLQRKLKNRITPSIDSILRLLNKHLTEIDKDKKKMTSDVTALLLDKNTVASYRTLLYDAKDSLLATPQAQKSFFVSVLYHVATDKNEETRLIDKYGQSVFSCSLCCRQTEMVDRSMMLAFCNTECRSLYKQNNK